MYVASRVEPLRERIASARSTGRRIAFVPTMGALHAGHRACVDVAREVEDAFVVCSIFVNPTQFGPGEDLDAYPRPIDADLARLRQWGCDAVFMPDVAVMYPEPQRTWVTVEGVSEPLCGRFRPGHFRGVTTVVARLFHIVAPDVAVFGQKDAQQALVIREMTAQLHFPTVIRLARTVREANGLALSSRNAYLDPGERARAAGIHRALLRVRDRIEAGERDARALEAAAGEVLRGAGIDDVDYAELRSADDLSALERVRGRVILAIAARVGTTRLIDNMVFDVSEQAVVSDAPLF